MLVLVLDTATPAVTAALVVIGSDGARLLASRVTVDARAHAEVLTPSLLACLAEAGMRPAALDAVVCGDGPGPFTGLRVGMATAAALGDALEVPVYGVCSLDGIGGATAHAGELLVVTDARRREVYWARYVGGSRTEGPGVCAPAELVGGAATAVAGWGGGGVVGGGAGGAIPIAARLGLPVHGPQYPDPLALVAAAELGAVPPPFLPRYLRRPDATEPAAAKAAS